MPLAGRDVDDQTAGAHIKRVGQIAVIIVKVFFEMAAEADNGIGGMEMPMDWHNRPRLDGIQHPLRLVFRRIPEIHVHAKPRRCFRLSGEVVENVLIDYHVMIFILYRSAPLSHFPDAKRIGHLSRPFRGPNKAHLPDSRDAKRIKQRPHRFRVHIYGAR